MKGEAMLHVIATVELNPGTRDAFLAEFKAVTPKVRAEDGCIEYVATIDASTDLERQQKVGADAVVIVEKWTSLAALKAHLVAPHMVAYRPKVKDYIRALSMRVLEPA
jgi:quinol monooxygenase YgiN